MKKTKGFKCINCKADIPPEAENINFCSENCKRENALMSFDRLMEKITINLKYIQIQTKSQNTKATTINYMLTDLSRINQELYDIWNRIP